jgi:prepilin-type N-terminal cleavage/methylation domain-containing protein
MKQNKAFSLIELSIVILIIGIIIAGVTQGSRLVTQSRIRTAQTLTESSPVTGVKGLWLWLESTSEDSFLTAQTEDGTQLTQWKDRNPQSVSKFYAVKTASSQVTYESEGINGLPTVNFLGTTGADAFFTLSTTTLIANSTPITTRDYSFTIFAVAKLDSTVTISDPVSRAIFYNGDSSSDGYGYYKSGVGADAGKRAVIYGGIGGPITTAATGTTNSEVITLTYGGISPNDNTLRMYTNGVAETLSGATGNFTTPITSDFRIGSIETGGLTPWKGFISELIVYEGALKASDRLEIERYLGKKYGIKVQ